MKLSVIIPYYNGLNKIKHCLQSILLQGLAADDFEILVVDDCSPQVCKREDLLHLITPPPVCR